MIEFEIDGHVVPLTLTEYDNKSPRRPLFSIAKTYTATGSFGRITEHVLEFPPFIITHIGIKTKVNTAMQMTTRSSEPYLLLNTSHTIPLLSRGHMIHTLKKRQFILENVTNRQWTILVTAYKAYEIWLFDIPISHLKQSVPMFPSLTRLYVNSLLKEPYGFPPISTTEKMRTEWNKIQTNNTNDPQMSASYLSTQTTMLIYEAFKQVESFNSILPAPSGSLEILIRKATQVIANEFYEEITLKTLSTRLNTNPSTLKRGFRAFLSTSVHGYLTERRLEVAVRKLIETNLNEGAIASETGFKKTRNLLYAFKAQLHCFPKFIRTGLGDPFSS